MTFRRIIFPVLILLILLLPVIWFTAPLWLSKGTEYILAQQQCSKVMVDIKAVGWNKIHINRLYCKDQKETFEIDVRGAEISYSPTELMKKRLEHVELKSVIFKQYASVDDKTDTKTAVLPMLTTPALLLEKLPLSSFNIREIHLQRLGLDRDVQQELKGSAHYSDQALSLVLNEENYLKGLQLKLKLDKKRGVNATLNQGENPILKIESSMHKSDSGLTVDGTTYIKLGPITELLNPWLNMPDQQLKGRLYGSWQISLPDQSSLGNKTLLNQLTASTSLKLDYVLSRSDSKRSRGKLNLVLQFKHGEGEWDIADGSKLAFTDKHKTTIDLSGLSGSFALTDSGWQAAVAEKSELKIQNIRTSDMFMPYITVRATAPIEVEMNPKNGRENKSLLQQLDVKAAIGLDFALNSPSLGSGRGVVGLKLKSNQGFGVWGLESTSFLSFGNKPKMNVKLSSLSGLFALSDSGFSATIDGNSELQIKDIVMDGMIVPHAQIKISRPVKLAQDKGGDIKLLDKAAIVVGLSDLKWQGNTLTSQDFKLSINRGSLFSASGQFSGNAIKFTSPTLQLPESNISGAFDLSGKQLSVAGKVDAQDSGIHLNWTLKHRFDRRKGELALSSNSMRFGVAGIDLFRIIHGQGDYAIEDGSLALNGKLQWQIGKDKPKTKLDTQFKLKLSNLKGHYKTNIFSGLSGDMLITGDENKLLMAPATVTLKRLYAGVPVNNISMSAAFAYPFSGLANIEINQFTAEALGGQISSEKISIDLARASNPFVVQLKHLDTGQIADIRRQEGLQVKGLLDGNLPFNWTRDGLKMTSGKLQATSAGGLIRYTGAESLQNLATTNQETKMVLDIMNNFHYKYLKIGADYRPDGELKMRIHLKGNNPGYENGRAIVLNFNIEENILKLLQGIGMAGDISDAVEKKVQKKLQQ